jgi:hypothetical protein
MRRLRASTDRPAAFRRRVLSFENISRSRRGIYGVEAGRVARQETQSGTRGLDDLLDL